jgi:hypothetical protein
MPELRKSDGTIIGPDEDSLEVEAIVTDFMVLSGNTACKCRRRDPSKWIVRLDGLAICRVCHGDAARITTDIRTSWE